MVNLLPIFLNPCIPFETLPPCGIDLCEGSCFTIFSLSKKENLFTLSLILFVLTLEWVGLTSNTTKRSMFAFLSGQGNVSPQPTRCWISDEGGNESATTKGLPRRLPSLGLFLTCSLFATYKNRESRHRQEPSRKNKTVIVLNPLFFVF